jgi:hypothetical protein
MTKNNTEMSWTACKNCPRCKGKSRFYVAWKDPCSVSVRKMERMRKENHLKYQILITINGYELLINAQSQDTIPTKMKAR